MLGEGNNGSMPVQEGTTEIGGQEQKGSTGIGGKRLFLEMLKSSGKSKSSETQLTVAMAQTMEEITSPAKPVAATSSHGFPRKSALMRKKATERRVSDIMCEVGGKSRSCAGISNSCTGIGCFSETLDLTSFKETLLCLKKEEERCLVWVGLSMRPCGCGKEPDILGDPISNNVKAQSELSWKTTWIVALEVTSVWVPSPNSLSSQRQIL